MLIITSKYLRWHRSFVTWSLKVLRLQLKEVGVTVPVVVRLEGTNADLGREVLANSDVDIIAAVSLTDAAQKVVAAAEADNVCDDEIIKILK